MVSSISIVIVHQVNFNFIEISCFPSNDVLRCSCTSIIHWHRRRWSCHNWSWTSTAINDVTTKKNDKSKAISDGRIFRFHQKRIKRKDIFNVIGGKQWKYSQASDEKRCTLVFTVCVSAAIRGRKWMEEEEQVENTNKMAAFQIFKYLI